MRRFIRALAQTGWDHDVWPVALLLFAVLLPAICLLWFMSAAMQNERLAARQKLADVHRARLMSAQARLEQHWNDKVRELEKAVQGVSPSAAFARCVQLGTVDSVIVRDQSGRVLYPNVPTVSQQHAGELDLKWAEAAQFEYSRGDFATAAHRYAALANETTNVNSAARAIQAQARCLLQAGRTNEAIRVVTETLSSQRFDRALDAQGRAVAANAELMVLELIADHDSPIFRTTLDRLNRRLYDYDSSVLAGSQRCFLMRETQRISPLAKFPTLTAEELAAEFAMLPSPAVAQRREGPVLQRTALPGVWQFPVLGDQVVALIRSDTLAAALRPILDGESVPSESQINLLPPEAAQADVFVSLAAGERWPGWQLAVVQAGDQSSSQAAAVNQASMYLWTGILMMAGTAVLALMAMRLLRRQGALARLKNDLAATVSHELKTPISSMRVLVDTLLDAGRFDEKKTREYLQLIARENERLSRLIQNFLTFSRMERNRYTFHFSPVPAGQIIDAVVESVRGRLQEPGCRFEVHAQENLPQVMADADALASALINLIDNAYKYSEEIKHIVLRACVEDRHVIFSVRDNGIGIAVREQKKIFRAFHQLDQRLTRKASGCGLGLSIVQFVVAAHQGSVSVESETGRGSTFTISVPALPVAAGARKEAIA